MGLRSPLAMGGIVAGACVLGIAGGYAYGSLGNEPMVPSGGEFGHFDNARTIHLAQDGSNRFIVADAGTGANDGRVVAITTDGGYELLLAGLPSAIVDGEVVGVNGAAISREGAVCAVTRARPGPGFASMHCNYNLVVPLDTHERVRRPSSTARSDPFDIVWNPGQGWLISDRGTGALLRVGYAGDITDLLVLVDTAAPGGSQPAGLDLLTTGSAGSYLAVAMLSGKTAVVPVDSAPFPSTSEVGPPAVAIHEGKGARCTIRLTAVANAGYLECNGGRIDDFTRPTGFVPTRAVVAGAVGEFLVVADGEIRLVHGEVPFPESD